MTATVARVPVAALTPAPWNPRTITDARFRNLCASLASDPAFMDRRPILALADGTIYAGNMRYRAARHLGWPDVPAVLEDVPDHVARERAVRDNQQWGEWQEDELAELLYELKAQERDVDTLGLDDGTVARLLASVGGPERADPDDVPEPPVEPVTNPGDLWLLGEHRLLCGDNTDVANWGRLMMADRARVAVTSPPYNQKIDSFRPSGMQRESPAFVERMASAYRDSKPEDQYQHEQVAFLEMMATYMIGDGSIFYNHKTRYREKRAINPHEWLSRLSFPIRQEIIWDRGSSITLNARMFVPADERVYWLRVGEDFIFNDDVEIKSWSTVWDIAAVNDADVTAPFAREIPLRCIRAASLPGDIVLDPHLGSGTTLIAAEQLGRRCYGMEIEPRYCDVIVERWQVFTGREARRG